jgi:CheY-like chemotaxis protein
MTGTHAHIRPTVLVVDDTTAVSTTLVWVLRQNGYHCSAARTKAEALQLCSEMAPDLVLIEMMLPDCSGIEAARELRRYAPGCRTLFMSSDPEAGTYLQQARAAGLDCELLPKPIPVADLLEKIQHALAPASRADSAHA